MLDDSEPCMPVGVFPLPEATLSKVVLDQTKSLDIGSCIF